VPGFTRKKMGSSNKQTLAEERKEEIRLGGYGQF
jgi:hypothetical protein